MKIFLWNVQKKFYFIVIIMAVFYLDSRFSYASKKGLPTDYIRVGLTKEFSKKDSLRIKNRNLLMGFSEKNIFYGLEKFYSEEGLKFTKKTGSFYFLFGEYSSLKKAIEEMSKLSEVEKEIIPVFSGVNEKKGRWKLCLYKYSERFRHLVKEVVRDDGMIEVDSGRERFFIDGATAFGYPQFVSATKGSETLIFLEHKRYRGRIEIGSYQAEGLTAVNIVRIEDYVKGVLPLEMGYTWHIEAMKAQAVAARSFGLATAGFGADSNFKKGFKLNNHSHQSYGGFDVEGKKPSQACEETAGEYVTYKNKVVRTFFYSTSGGATEFPSNVWGGKKGYLKSVPDLYENKPEKKPWTIFLTKEDIEKFLKNASAIKTKQVGKVEAIEMIEVSESGRVKKLKIQGSAGSLLLKNNEIRTFFNLPSTKFTVFKTGEKTDMVTILFGKLNSRQKQVGLKGMKVLSSKGLSKLLSREKNGGQTMVLSKTNRKGFYIGGKRKEADYIFVGNGFGHGVGMSQSGARGMAEAGFGYKEILRHYFRETVVN